jgi:uncharacterized protein DUF6285
MQDRPTAPELLDSLAEYLVGELRPEAPAEQRFKVLVAANLCAVVARELRAGEDPSAADAALFRSLLGMPAAEIARGEADAAAEGLATELSARIRAGDLDDRLPELIEALRGHVKRKLDIARPGYAP